MTGEAFGSAFDTGAPSFAYPDAQPSVQFGIDAPQAPKAAAPLPAPIEVANSPIAAPVQKPTAFLQGQTMPGEPSGLSDNYHRAVAQIESSGGTQYGNGGGMYQFIPSTAKTLGYTQDQIRAMTPEQQTALNEKFTTQNTALLVKAGLPVNDTTAYLAHQQGAGGAVKLLQADPNVQAASVVGVDAAKGNKPFFYNADGSPKTVAQTLDKFQHYVTSAGASGSVPAGVASSQPNAPKADAQPKTIGERMKAWVAAQAQPTPAAPVDPAKPQKPAAAADDPQQVAQQFQVSAPTSPLSGIVRSGGKVYFQRYGRTYDTSGNPVG